ncbi:DUF5977 domain-containing protein, partial [Pedobacter sp. Hv1]|uniref:DUF5977 domain-containing protein n=1 Tax=Pedobacter sp. Hv1 TaxID=1740090 RepID=UPI00128F3C44
MKKILLLFASCIAFLPCFGQITISAPTSATSGSTFTITASGETSSKYVAGMFLFPSPQTTTNPAYQSVVIANLDIAGYPYSISGQPTKFSTKITTTATFPVTVTFNVRCDIFTSSQASNQDQTITITINPAVTTFYNVAKSGVFTRNNCGPGTAGSDVTYTIPANTYSASSQAAADQLA